MTPPPAAGSSPAPPPRSSPSVAEEEDADDRPSAPVMGVAPPTDGAANRPGNVPDVRGDREESNVMDKTLYAALGIKPLGAAQKRAVLALRQRLGEHIAENTDPVPTQPRTILAPSVTASQPPIQTKLYHPFQPWLKFGEQFRYGRIAASDQLVDNFIVHQPNVTSVRDESKL